MRPAARASGPYAILAMLLAAAAGRCFDRLALLPGVHETAAVRGGAPGWVAALLAAALLGVATAVRWTRTPRVAAVAPTVLGGQLLVFLIGEAAARFASGQGPVDPDGLLGAALQAVLALTLLMVLGISWLVALHCAALRPPAAARASGPPTARPVVPPPCPQGGAVPARGPPVACAPAT